MNNFYQQPELEGDGWYNWRIQHWGTKWDVEAKLAKETKKSLKYQFDSAWSPPTDWLEKVALDYLSLTFILRYAEGGVGFAGELIVEDGLASNAELDYADAQISWHGSVNYFCTRCQDDFDSTVVLSGGERLCPEHYGTQCTTCFGFKEDHAKRKCLFGPTKYTPRGPTEVGGLYVTQPEEKTDG